MISPALYTTLFHLLGAAGCDDEAFIQVKRIVASEGFDPNYSLDSRVLLTEAAERSDVRVLDLLLTSGAQVNVLDVDGKSPLMHAAARASLPKVLLLLERGADVNLMRFGSSPALSYAAGSTMEGGLECVMALLAAGANVNQTSLNRMGNPSGSSLISACRNGNIAAAQTLIAAGADVNLVVPFGTAMAQAAAEGKLEIVRALLQSGADPTLSSPANPAIRNAGKTPLELARLQKRLKIVEFLESATGVAELARVPELSLSISETWGALEQGLSKRRLTKKVQLLRGVADAEIRAAESVLHAPFPPQLRKSYGICNGQAAHSVAFIPSPSLNVLDGHFRWLTLDEVQNEWKRWKSLIDSQEFSGRIPEADEGVRTEWFHPGWIPFLPPMALATQFV